MTPDNAAGENADAPPVAPPPPRRGPGHRGQDIRDTMAEMAAKAHEISLEAGSKMASAMRDVVGAAAGISAFAIESARDLVNYMVRRGQMSQDEATKLLLEVEEAHAKRPKVELPKKAEKVEVPKAAAAPAVKAPEKPTAPAKSVKAEVVEKSEKAAPAKAPKLEKAAPKAAAKAPAPPKAAAKPAAKAAAKPAKKR
jgi:polyhydroxyalkanoate synthesis regulator phasin